MNSISDMNPVILQTPMADSGLQDKSAPEKSEFASIVENECSKSAKCKSDRKEIKSENVIKGDDGLSDDRQACNDCSTGVDNTMHDTSGKKEQLETDDIESVNKNDDHPVDEAGPGKGLKTGALLFNLLNEYMAEIGDASQVSTGEGTSETAGIGAGGPGSESASENGLKVETLLNNLVSGSAAEIEVVSVPGSETNQNAELKGAESGEVGPDLHTENGLKIGDLMGKLLNRSVEKESGNGTGTGDVNPDKGQPAEESMKLNTKSDPAETADLTLKKEIPAEGEIVSKVSRHTEKNHADDKTVVMDMPESNDSSEGLKSRLMSGSTDQSSHENGTGDNTFNFAKGPHNSGNDAETNNVNSINTSNTALETAKSVQSPSALHTAKAPGVQELLDNVIYVIKGKSSMGVTVEHENFGKLNISLSLEKGMVNVHINTSDQAVREIIENNMQHIIDSLNKDGVSVGEFSVDLRGQGEQEINRFSLKNGQGGETPLKTKNEHRHSGLVNIFA